MFDNTTCYRLAAKKANQIFGTKYLKANKKDVILARTDHGDVCQLFVGIKGESQRPNLKPEAHGWTVYANIYVDKETGFVKVDDYQLDEES